jgi:DNA-binding response OmpR family regulator
LKAKVLVVEDSREQRNRLQALLEATRDAVIVMLTVKGEVKERVEGLHVGADDYLPNAELEGMLSRAEQVATTDAVTGLFNRRRFTDVLEREWARIRVKVLQARASYEAKRQGRDRVALSKRGEELG